MVSNRICQNALFGPCWHLGGMLSTLQFDFVIIMLSCLVLCVQRLLHFVVFANVYDSFFFHTTKYVFVLLLLLLYLENLLYFIAILHCVAHLFIVLSPCFCSIFL